MVVRSDWSQTHARTRGLGVLRTCQVLQSDRRQSEALVGPGSTSTRRSYHPGKNSQGAVEGSWWRGETTCSDDMPGRGSRRRSFADARVRNAWAGGARNTHRPRLVGLRGSETAACTWAPTAAAGWCRRFLSVVNRISASYGCRSTISPSSKPSAVSPSTRYPMGHPRISGLFSSRFRRVTSGRCPSALPLKPGGAALATEIDPRLAIREIMDPIRPQLVERTRRPAAGNFHLVPAVNHHLPTGPFGVVLPLQACQTLLTVLVAAAVYTTAAATTNVNLFRSCFDFY